ncbi:hypothetical protein C8J57DRAFT_1598927 [Mycena rebaudengoi]|nr:hypothetical protein C8J57DRAFT_1613038 [Mycena rebaudengoi]KAJ7216838.1 hypothetical protein C8J57DRAFT_1598927 [Mycena rebaudengoi]
MSDGRGSMFSALPLELLDEIVQFSTPLALLSLCKTSKRINTACLRWIYQIVYVDDPARLVKCCQTLMANAQAASAVRLLLIQCNPKQSLKALHLLFSDTLKKLRSLEYLDVGGSTDLFSICATLRFPRLRHCSIPFSIDFVSFLTLHPKLVELTMDAIPHESVQTLTEIIPIHLPDLQRFTGPDRVAVSVIPRSRTFRILVFWDPRSETKFSEAFTSFALSNAEVVEMKNILVSWDPALLTAAATSIPGLTALSISNVSSIAAPSEMEEFFAAIDDALKALTKLRALAIIQGSLPAVLDTADLDWEFDTVRRWADIAPELTCVLLPSETKWMRIRANVWYPTNNDDSLPGLLARFRWFINTVIPSTVLSPDYAAVLELISGREIMKELKAGYERDGVVPNFELAQKDGGISLTLLAPESE